MADAVSKVVNQAAPHYFTAGKALGLGSRHSLPAGLRKCWPPGLCPFCRQIAEEDAGPAGAGKRFFCYQTEESKKTPVQKTPNSCDT